MAGENTCGICLDSLFKDNCTDLGVCNPCGHPYHVSCFQQWEASKMDPYSRDRSRVKCPYCSSHTESFHKIYLSAPTADYGMDDDDDDDDDSSVSSIESAADPITDLMNEMENLEDEEMDTNPDGETGKSNETEEVIEGDQPESSSNQSAKSAEHAEPNSDVVDLTASPEPKKKRKSKTATDEADAGGINMKRKMKHYRKQAKQSKSRLQEFSKQFRQLAEKHNEMKQKVKEAEQSKIEYQSSHGQNLLELQQTRLENVTLKRQLTNEKQDRQRSEEKYSALSLRFSRFEKASNDRLEKIRNSQNVETQKMLAEYPKLKEENKRLAETNEKQNKYLAEIRTYMKKLDPDIRERVERNVGREPSDSNAGIMNQRQLKEGLKTFQDMSEGSHKRKRAGEQSTTHKLASNPRVARVEQARAPKKANANRSRNVDALFGKLDHHRKQTGVPAAVQRRVSTDSTSGGGSNAQSQQSKRGPSAAAQPQQPKGSNTQRQQPKGSSAAQRQESNAHSPIQRHKPKGSTNAQRMPLAPSINLSANPKRKPMASNRALFSKKSNGNGDIRTWF